MTEKNNGNNKSEIKWREDTEKEHPGTALDESVVSLCVKGPQAEETEKQIKNYNSKQNYCKIHYQ